MPALPPPPQLAANKSGLNFGSSTLQLDQIFVGGKSLRRRPGMPVAPVTTSASAYGWGTAGCTLAIGPIASPLSGTTGNMLRVTGGNGTSGASYAYIRRVINMDSTGNCQGKIEFPVNMPYGAGVGATVAVHVSSDAPAANPPSASPANYLAYTFQPSQFKRGQTHMLSVNFNASAATQPDPLDGTGIVTVGSGANLAAITQVEFYIYIPGTAGSSPWIDIGDVTAGAVSTPHVMLGFDGAGADTSHFAFVAPLLEKYNLKASFSPQGQVIAGYAAHLQNLYARGHDITNEGQNHTNYSTNPAMLIADATTTYNALVSLGMPRAAKIFSAPQNALQAVGSGSAGIADLYHWGAPAIRTGTKWNIALPANGQGVEPLNFGPFSCDQSSAPQLDAYLDMLELHGESGMFLFHSIYDNTGGGNAGVLQCNLTDFSLFLARLANRIAQGRMVNCTISEFVKVANS